MINEKVRNGFILKTNCPFLNLDNLETLDKIRLLEKKKHRLDEDSANGTIDNDQWEIKDNKIRDKVNTLIQTLRKEAINMSVEFQNDPRGSAIKVFITNKETPISANILNYLW